MNWTLWWAFAVTSILLALSPGPAVLMVLASALRGGVGAGVRASLGILSANAAYFALSATSIGALLVASSSLFFWVKWIGAAYLAYLGLRALFAKSSVLIRDNEPANLERNTSGRVYASAFLTQVSNPKALIYFAAILPQFVDLHFPAGRQIAILGVTSTVLEFLVLLGYGTLAGRAMYVARKPRYAIWTNRIAGLLLLSAGVGMAVLRRS